MIMQIIVCPLYQGLDPLPQGGITEQWETHFSPLFQGQFLPLSIVISIGGHDEPEVACYLTKYG